jgi:hypothetical protein
LRALCYDGQGYWLAQKRLSTGRFRCWPQGASSARVLEAHQAHLLLAGGDPSLSGAPVWRPVKPRL